MTSKVSSALRILREEGSVALYKKSTLFLAGKVDRDDQFSYRWSVKEVEKRKKNEDGLEDILDTVLDIKPGYSPYKISASQLREEIKYLATLIRKEQPETVVEIGTASGGTFYVWSRFLNSADTLVSLDLPGGRFGGGYTEQKTDIFRKFAPSKKTEFVRKNSHQQETYNEVSDIIDGEIDFLFIDGDHTYEGVKQDFEMYSELVAEDGIIAFHDIATHPDDQAVVQRRRRNLKDAEDRHLKWNEVYSDCNVDQLWKELVEKYETEEIMSHPNQTWGGIGVVRI